MGYDFDSAKDRTNLDKHGLSMAEAAWFEWETAIIQEDTRKQYPEARFQAVGYIRDRLHVMVYCLRADAVRIISLRKANAREVAKYAKT